MSVASVLRAPTARAVGWRADLRAALPGWLAARALVVVALALAGVFEPVVDVDPLHRAFAEGGLLGWDADWYRRIAVHGYESLPDEAVRFFPLLPLAARVLGVGTWVGAGVALLVVANAAALVAGAAVHRLVLVEGGDEPTARQAATLLALAPPAFALVMGYSEALAIALVLGYVLCLHRRAWGVAVVLGGLAGLVRPIGLLLVVVGLVAGWSWWRSGGWSARRRWLVPGLAAVAPVVGAGLYLLWAQVATGDWRAPYDVQTADGLRGELVDPLAGALRALGALGDGDLLVRLHVAALAGGLVLVALGARRWSPGLTLWALATLLVALTASHLGSVERYVWASVVPVMTLAAVGSPGTRRLVTAGFAAGFLVLATAAFLGAYVP